LHISKKSSTFATQFVIYMSDRITKAQIKWVRSLQQKKNRDEQGLFVAEGIKCVNDLRNAFDLELLIDSSNATTTEISQMSSMRTPQGVIAVFRKKTAEAINWQKCQLVVALDGVQDPGNLGTIIRTCDWFGVHDILCSTDTADCYNPKVVQATMGALSRVNIHYVDLSTTITAAKSAGYPIYGTLLNGQNIYHANSVATPEQGIIIMGNEGNGISDHIRTLVTHPLLIPSYPANTPTSESLNVGIATAIVLAEFRRLIH